MRVDLSNFNYHVPTSVLIQLFVHLLINVNFCDGNLFMPKFYLFMPRARLVRESCYGVSWALRDTFHYGKHYWAPATSHILTNWSAIDRPSYRALRLAFTMYYRHAMHSMAKHCLQARSHVEVQVAALSLIAGTLHCWRIGWTCASVARAWVEKGNMGAPKSLPITCIVRKGAAEPMPICVDH